MCAAAVMPFEHGPRPTLRITTLTLKNKLPLVENCLLPAAGYLSPDIKEPSLVPPFCVGPENLPVKCIGKYLLLEQLATCTGSVETRSAVDISTEQKFICRIFPLSTYRQLLAPYWQSGHHEHIADVVEVLLGAEHAFVLFRGTHDDLHAYVRRRRRLREDEAARLFRQILSAVKHCHKRGIVLRDLKLRRFMFADPARTHLVLDGLEDAVLLEDNADDRLTDKHGCPAYVSPEILTSRDYSGRAADTWSLGVILYTLLVGQYPFHDPVATQLFAKIRRGQYTLPADTCSPQARCLLRGLLRTDPTERLTVREAAQHPWFDRVLSRSLLDHTPAPPYQSTSAFHTTTTTGLSASRTGSGVKEWEQRVPELIHERNEQSSRSYS